MVFFIFSIASLIFTITITEQRSLVSYWLIYTHFVGVEIPGFDLSNRFSGLTTSLLFRDGIHRVIFNKYKKLKLFK
jgi:hypothetical protein